MSYTVVPPAKQDWQIVTHGPCGLEILMEFSVIHTANFIIFSIFKNQKNALIKIQ